MMIRRTRTIAVCAILLAGGLGVLGSTQPWVHLTLRAGAVDVTGSAALPALTAVSLAVLALAGALTIAGRMLRELLGALALIAGIGLLIATVRIVSGPPVEAISSTVSASTGIAGSAAIQSLLVHAAVSGWAWAALCGWAVLILAGALVLATAHSWHSGGRRYDTSVSSVATAAGGPLDAIDSWEALNRGSDPTALHD